MGSLDHTCPPVNRLLHFCVISALLAPGAARAHGGDPTVLSVLALDAQGAPMTLQLNEGLVARDAEGFHFVCPAAWGSEEHHTAAAVPDGAIVIAGSAGLFLLDPQTGAVTPHPAEATRGGDTLALRVSGRRVLQLRGKNDLTELVEVDREAARVLFTDTARWTGLDASAESIVLARLDGGELEQLRLSPAGETLERRRAAAPAGSLDVRPRLLRGAPVLVLLTDGGLGAQLTRIEGDGTLALLHETGGTLLGPIDDGAGGALLAAGGQLARLLDDADVEPLDGTAAITCLGVHGSLRYACDRGALHAVDAAGLGARLFHLGQLQAPQTGAIEDADDRERCEVQWARYRLDLRDVGIEPLAPDASQASDPDAGASDQAPDAGGPATDPDGSGDDDAPARAGADGCSAAPHRGDAAPPWLLAGLAGLTWLGGLAARRQPRRRRARAPRV